MEKLDIIINQSGVILENVKVHKDFTFNMENIIQFIKTSTEIILSDLKKYDI